MEKNDMRSQLKDALRGVPVDAPAVETVEPEIRTAAQYQLPSMRDGFRFDEANEEL